MKIAILGSRGIPGTYGGFETCAEELATRLTRKGHEVTVYCCKPYSRSDEKIYKGFIRGSRDDVLRTIELITRVHEQKRIVEVKIDRRTRRVEKIS